MQERGFRTKRQGVTGIGMTSASDKEDGESKWKLFSNVCCIPRSEMH